MMKTCRQFFAVIAAGAVWAGATTLAARTAAPASHQSLRHGRGGRAVHPHRDAGTGGGHLQEGIRDRGRTAVVPR